MSQARRTGPAVRIDEGHNVDFWDLTKLLVRRWRIALPMLLLSTALAVLTITQVRPNYVATAYVQLVPPVITETKVGDSTVDQRNPWIGLGLQTIGNAAIVTVTDQSVQEQMTALGYSDSYTLTMGSTSPMVTFEVVGTSRSQARTTAGYLVERFSQSVANLQSADGVASKDAITARRLDRGTNVEVSDSKVKRAFVAVLAAGLLVSAASTVGIDAWLRRRMRRRAADGTPPPATPRSVPPAANNDRLSPPDSVIAATRSHSRTDQRDEVPAAAMIPATAVPLDDTSNGHEKQSHPPIPSDATIVLPQTRP